MTCRKPPWVFRISGVLMITAVVVGGWWQHQPIGATGRAFLTTVAHACPAAANRGKNPIVADTAHALDRWIYAELGNLLFRGGRDRCARGVLR